MGVSAPPQEPRPDLVHVDIERLGDIPDGGHKAPGRQAGRKTGPRHAWAIRPTRSTPTPASPGARSTQAGRRKPPSDSGSAHGCLTTAGITVQRALTGNGACQESHLWLNSLARQEISRECTRPYRPRTNGKVERFNRALLDERAYAKPYRTETETERCEACPAWPHTCNHHRGHRAPGPTTRKPRPPPRGSVHGIALGHHESGVDAVEGLARRGEGADARNPQLRAGGHGRCG